MLGRRSALAFSALALAVMGLGCDAHRNVSPRPPRVELVVGFSRGGADELVITGRAINRGGMRAYYQGACGWTGGVFFEVLDARGDVVEPGPCTPVPLCLPAPGTLDPGQETSNRISFRGVLHDCEGDHPAERGVYTVVARFEWSPASSRETGSIAETRSDFDWPLPPVLSKSP